MKVTVTKYEDVEVEVSEEQVEYLMCKLLKKDYDAWKQLPLVEEESDLFEAMKVVYEVYAGKPIDLVERFSH